jgi:hypothetical protein
MAAVFLAEGGLSDSFYLRFTSPKQQSMIIGTSRAAQGLMPSVINAKLKDKISHPFYNFAFTVYHSPYGNAYFKGIQNKLDATTKNGLFIVAVDPWSISVESDQPNDENLFPERSNFLASLHNVSMNPNVEYLLNFYGDPYYNILLRRFKPSHLRLHDDGWLEASVDMDSVTVKKRTKAKLEKYRYANAARYRFSDVRFEYLNKIISLLKQHGEVYLVRLPVHQKMLEIESGLMPDFNEKIRMLISKHELRYFDMTQNGQKYAYTDGNHLHKSSSKIVSKEVADWITSFQIAHQKNQ